MATRNPLSLVLRCFSILPDYFFHFLARPDEQTRRWLWVLLSGEGVLLALTGLFAYFAGWIYPLVLWVGPALCALALLAFAFDWLPHHPHTNRERYRDTNVILFPGLTFVLLSQNYHLIHHLYPTIPFYSYGRVFRKLRPFLEEQGSPIYDWRGSGRS